MFTQNHEPPITGNAPHLSYKQKLTELAADILAPGDLHYGMAYSDMLFELADVKSDDSQRQHIETGHGKAIGTFWAAFCARQVIRTQRFCRGLYHAITDVLSTRPNRPVHVVYAGTGPFATLALPVMLQFTPREVQFTLLEINPESFNKLKTVLRTFDVEDYVKHMELCDAITWQAPDKEVDIVISETMERALGSEPQISIMLNMVKQLNPEVIYIPEDITVGVAYNEVPRPEISGGTAIYSFNKAKYQQIIERSAGGSGWSFDKTRLEYKPIDGHKLVYTTDIKVYGDDELHFPDCSFNHYLKVDVDLPAQNAVIEFQYQDGSKPGFKATVAG